MYSRLVYYTAVSLLTISLFLSSAVTVEAQEYVLPYPGFMPGSPFYRVSEAVHRLQEWWSFGSFAKFNYNLSQADKKLVEAKILFEYKQYVLAQQAILAYDRNLQSAFTYLGNAKGEGKDISQKKLLFKRAIAKQKEILEKLKKEQPESFLWRPEKKEPQLIKIRELLDGALAVGKTCEENL